MDRRTLIKTAFAASAAFAAPAGLSTQTGGTAERDRRLLALARDEVARALAGGHTVWRRDIVGIADFGLHSSQRRFHFVDIEKEGVASYHVSHGTGSDSEHDGWLKRYSNVEGSEATSRGAYLTRSWYTGRYGTSLRLDGLDPTNSNALPRAIVMHQANYATPEHVDRWGRLGRSNGCLAMGPEQFDRALIDLSGGRLIVAGSYGFAEDGSIVRPPVVQTDLLRSDRGGTFEQANPGVF